MIQWTTPKGFRSNRKLNDEYEAVRGDFLPLLCSKARFAGIAGLLDVEDLLQELELRALYGVATYDPEKGKLLTWIGLLADQTIRAFLDYAFSPTHCYRSSMLCDNEWREVKVQPYSLETEPDSCLAVESLIAASAEDFYVDREADLRAQNVRARFRARVDREVDGFARDLFWARINPPVELLVFARNQTGRLPESPDQLRLETVARFYEVPTSTARETWGELQRVVARVVGEFNDDDRRHLGG